MDKTNENKHTNDIQRTNKCAAVSESFGTGIANSYRKDMNVMIIASTALNIPNNPKSEGE
jgi:hypothetical protein